MSASIEEGLAELAREAWPWRVAEMAMFAHATSPTCLGYTYGGYGWAKCTACDWRLGCFEAFDPPAIGRFALVALSLIGITFDLVHQETARIVGVDRKRVRLLEGGAAASVDEALNAAAFTVSIRVAFDKSDVLVLTDAEIEARRK